MKKFILAMVMVFVLSCVAFASVNVMVDGKLYGPAQDLDFPAGTTITQAGPTMGFDLASTGLVSTITSGTINGAAIGGSAPAAGAFTTVAASGAIDGATTLAVGTANALTVAATGALVTTGTAATGALTVTGAIDGSTTLAIGTNDAFSVGATGIIIDGSLYATTQGVGGNRTVCVSADGKIFSSPTACP